MPADGGVVQITVNQIIQLFDSAVEIRQLRRSIEFQGWNFRSGIRSEKRNSTS